MNSFRLIEDYIFANDFLRFFDRSGHLKKRKKSRFFEIWKKRKIRKIRILEHCPAVLVTASTVTQNSLFP